jgi:putative thioredoxin
MDAVGEAMIDSTLSSFERDVIEASMEVPVLVDFWAPWCGPCKVLGPLLEKLEREYGGRWKLVNVNSDANPELASSFNLRSIPYAVAFVDGNPVAQFMGAQPESYLRAFLDRLIPNPGELEHRAAREAIAQGQVGIAREYLKNAIAMDPTNDGARVDMVSILLEDGEIEEARRNFDTLSANAEQQSSFEAVRDRLVAAERAATLPPEAILVRRLDDAPEDLQARLDLAELKIAQREYRPALEQLLEIVRRDRGFGDDVARQKMLSVFAMAATDEDLVTEYRSKLSSVLY